MGGKPDTGTSFCAYHFVFPERIEQCFVVNFIVHTRDAKQDTLKILKEENAGDVGGVLHCFTEDWDMAYQALDLNFYISFSGIVTFKNARDVQDVAKKIPSDRFHGLCISRWN